MVDLNRFEFGVPDMQEAKVIHECCVTGEEIYEGNSFLQTIEGDIVLDNDQAILTYYRVERKVAGEEVED